MRDLQKRSLCLLLALMLCLSVLAACSGPEEANPPEPSEGQSILPEPSVTLPEAAPLTQAPISTTEKDAPVQAAPLNRESVTGEAKPDAGTYTGLTAGKAQNADYATNAGYATSAGTAANTNAFFNKDIYHYQVQ